ncbi:MAG: hypothetical protein ACREOK_10060 [Gemmatimonadaceae bacterium]
MVSRPQQAGSIKTPETRAELEALLMRRNELRDQLSGSEERRNLLAGQAVHGPPAGRAALEARVATLDGRIVDIERRLQQLDDAIARGMANTEVMQGGADVASTVIARPAPAPRPAPQPVIMLPPPGSGIDLRPRTLLVGGLVSFSLLALVGWLAFRYALARMSRLVGAAQTGSTQITQLQQSVDAIAVEVERISENQRYVTKLLGQQTPGPTSARGGEELERVSARLPREK